jgi:hypothetical protein
MIEEVRIDKGIPMPKKSSGGRGKWLKAIQQMRVGDSIYVSNIKDCVALRRAMYREGMKMKQRREGNGIRVWRV